MMLAIAESLAHDCIEHLLEDHIAADDVARAAWYLTGAFALCSRASLDRAAVDLLDRVSDRLLEISRIRDDTARRAALVDLHETHNKPHRRNPARQTQPNSTYSDLDSW